MQEENKNEQAQEAEKGQEENVEKDGVTLLKEIGLKEVSNKTFINLENLTSLLDKDFAKLNRTKAMGFIQILQREFDVDLEDLKQEYLDFNSGTKVIEDKTETVVANSVYEVDSSKKLLSYLSLGAVALLAAYFLFFNEEKKDNFSPMDLNVVKNDVVIDEAKESLLAVDEAYEKEVNESDEVDLNKVVEEMFKNSDLNESESREDNETNSSESDEVNQSAILPASEEKISLLEDVENAAVKEEKKLEPEVVEETKVVEKPKKKVVNKNPGGLYIEPIKKAWVGVIFLDSMKKKDFLIRKTLKLDASKDQIILVGHKNFKIFNKKLEQGFKSKKMVRFVYRDGELREISKQEYLNLQGGARW